MSSSRRICFAVTAKSGYSKLSCALVLYQALLSVSVVIFSSISCLRYAYVNIMELGVNIADEVFEIDLHVFMDQDG